MQKKSLILHPHGNILSRKSLQNHIITAGEFGLMEMFDVTVIGAGPAGFAPLFRRPAQEQEPLSSKKTA